MKDFSRYYYKNKIYNNESNILININENINIYDIFQEMYKFVHDYFTKFQKEINFQNILNFTEKFKRKSKIIIIKCLKAFFCLQCISFNNSAEDDNKLLDNEFNYTEIDCIMMAIVLNIQEEDNNPPEEKNEKVSETKENAENGSKEIKDNKNIEENKLEDIKKKWGKRS